VISGKDFFVAIVALILIGMGFGAVLMWALSLAWGWLKPLLHALTG